MYYRDYIKEIVTDGFLNFKLIGFGNACWAKGTHSKKVTSRSHRSPEVILGLHFEAKADIWAAGCVIFKTVTLNDMFYPKQCPKYSTDENHLSHIIKLFGELSQNLICRSHKAKVAVDLSQALFKNGKLNKINRHKITSLEECLIEDYRVTKANARWLAGFLKPLMQPDPFKRSTAIESLRSRWLLSTSSPRGSLFMNDREWHDSLWNLNVVEDADARRKTVTIDSEGEDADVGEYDSDDSEVSFGRPWCMIDSTCGDDGGVLHSDRSFLERLVLEGKKMPHYMNLDQLDMPSMYEDLK